MIGFLIGVVVAVGVMWLYEHGKAASETAEQLKLTPMYWRSLASIELDVRVDGSGSRAISWPNDITKYLSKVQIRELADGLIREYDEMQAAYANRLIVNADKITFETATGEAAE